MLRGWALLLTLTAAASTDAAAQGPDTWGPAMALASESRVWLEGTSNVNRFTCRAVGLAQSIQMGSPSEVWEITELPEPLQRAALGIPVRSLRCGNKRMDRDLYRAMRTDEFPLMTFRLWTYQMISPPAAGAFTVKAVGALGLAGRENVVMVDVQVERRPDGKVRVRGSKALRMSDFGIEPPTAMLGLIKAHDRVVVRFDLVADPHAAIGIPEGR